MLGESGVVLGREWCFVGGRFEMTSPPKAWGSFAKGRGAAHRASFGGVMPWNGPVTFDTAAARLGSLCGGGPAQSPSPELLSGMRILSLYASWKLVELAECRMCIWAATCPRNGRLVVKWPLKRGRLFVRGDAPGPSFFPTRTPGRRLTAAFNALLALIALAPCLQRHIFHPRPSLPWTDLQCQDIPPPSGVPSLRQIEM